MHKFLKIYKDPVAIRTLLESIHPIAFGQVNGKLWTTTGELERFASDGSKGCGARVTKGMFDFAEAKVWRIKSEDEAKYLATQMGKPEGCFCAGLAQWKFLGAIPPEVALLAIVAHESPRSDAVRAAVGIPKPKSRLFIAQLEQAISSNQPHPAWEWNRTSKIEPIKPITPEQPKSAVLFGDLSGLLRTCLAEEAKAKDRHDRAVTALEVARLALEEATSNTKVISQAAEIAERFAPR